jgi:glutathione S-transferase
LVGISRRFRHHMLELRPPGKVPSLVRADGERLWDSRAILDFLHGRASLRGAEAPPGTARRGGSRGPRREGVRARHRIRRSRARDAGSHMIARLERQIGSTLAWLELQRPAPFLVGPSFSVGDVTAAVALNVHQREVAPAFALWPGACLYRSGRRLRPSDGWQRDLKASLGP